MQVCFWWYFTVEYQSIYKFDLSTQLWKLWDLGHSFIHFGTPCTKHSTWLETKYICVGQMNECVFYNWKHMLQQTEETAFIKHVISHQSALPVCYWLSSLLHVKVLPWFWCYCLWPVPTISRADVFDSEVAMACIVPPQFFMFLTIPSMHSYIAHQVWMRMLLSQLYITRNKSQWESRLG